MTATRIHHINFVVRDLDEASSKFETLLGLQPFEVHEHAARGARVARSKVGESWIVLVCPTDPESVPGKFLAQHGEGMFLLSVGTPDLDTELARLSRSGMEPRDRKARKGILDWRVADVAEVYGTMLHLTDDKSSRD